MKKLFPLLFTALLAGCVSTDVTRTTESKASVIVDEPVHKMQTGAPPKANTVIQADTPSGTAKKTKPTAQAVIHPKSVKPVTRTKDGKLILGQQEWVWLSPVQQFVRAYVVQTQTESTLGVSAILPFERDGHSWVKFEVRGQSFEMPVHRWQEINEQKLAVVQVGTVLGELNDMTDFVLVDGQGVRLGAEFIRDVAVVDPSRKFVQPKTKNN